MPRTIKNRYDPTKNLSETDIRYAMENTLSNFAASRFLKVSYDTYKKYAKRYKNEDGQNLFEVHKNAAGRGIRKGSVAQSGALSRMQDILNGKHPKYDPKKLKRRLIKECILPEECGKCGYKERRESDYKIPLILNWKDGDNTNHRKENLEFMCYNCIFLYLSDRFLQRLCKAKI